MHAGGNVSWDAYATVARPGQLCPSITSSPVSLPWQPQESQRLYKDTTVLEDGKSLADLKVENDDVLGLTYKQEGRRLKVWQAVLHGHKFVL